MTFNTKAMKALLIAVLALTSVQCANKNNLCPVNDGIKLPCPEIYDPVCAISNNGMGQNRVTMTNKCFACNDDKTQFVVSGACEDYPLDAYFCNPKNSDLLCAQMVVYDVCGYYDSSVSCVSPPCNKDFSNICTACIQENISYTIMGKCLLK